MPCGMGVKSDLMTSRAACALTLREFDNELRGLMVRTALPQSLRERRERLAENLRAVGGVPWDYDPRGDNSWLAR